MSNNSNSNNTLKALGFAFCLVGTIMLGWCLIPLAWCIPLTIRAYKYYKGEGDLTVGLKVCILLFVSILAGIFLLCVPDEEPAPEQPSQTVSHIEIKPTDEPPHDEGN